MRTSTSSVITVVAILATLLPVYARVITLDTRTVDTLVSPNVRIHHRGLEVRVAQDRAEENDSEFSQTSMSARPTRTMSVPNSEEEDGKKKSTSTTTKNVESSTRTAEDKNKPTASAGKKVEGVVLPTETAPPSEPTKEYRDSEDLPIQPKLNAALGIAGVLLIFAGAPYAFIGIKSKRIQIFGSVMFLSALSVTVLIIYVMNPPVSAGIQGAYLVAAVVTGCILGAISVIFHEMTEGLGCLLGGFCLGMWVLVTKPGGLVTIGAGKSVLLALFALTPYFLSFWHTARQEVLIGSVSFAGATAAVLGIDCFSRAGLKEFWLYIWDLNPKTFPQGTHSYPHTRGIKVEIAAIIIVALLATLSQLRIWNVVKQHREKKEQTRLEELKAQEKRDLEVGRKNEECTRMEREMWEAQFGGGVKKKGKGVVVEKEKSDDGKGDSGFNSRRNSRTPSEMEGAREADGQPESSREQSFDNGKRSFEVGESSSTSRRTSRRFSSPPSQEVVEGAVQTEEDPVEEGQDEEEVDPAMVPLPPSKADLLAEEKRKAEMIPPVEVPKFDPKKVENRVSELTFVTLDELDWEDHETGRTAAAEAMEARRVERQRAERAKKEKEHQKNIEAELEGLVYYADDDRASSVHADLGDFEIASISSVAEEEVQGTTTSPASPVEESGLNNGTESEETTITTPSDQGEEKLGDVAVEKEDAGKKAALSDIKESIARMPKAYRTNQWALHLSKADEPGLEELETKQEEAEKPAPVMVEDLLATYLPAQRPISTSKPTTTKRSSSAAVPQAARINTTRTSSVQVTAHAPNRTSTIPILPLTVDNIRPQSILTPLPTFNSNTLLAKRESQMKSRPSYILSNHPSNRTPSTLPPTLPSPHPLSTNNSYNLSAFTSALDSGYVSPAGGLSRNQSTTGIPSLPYTTNPAPLANSSSDGSKVQGYDDDIPLSHRRTELLASQKRAQREALMAQWRQSLQADEHIKQQKAQVERVLSGTMERKTGSMENKVAVALELKRRKEEMAVENAKGMRGNKMKELRAREQRKREKMEARMRMPDMLEKHREAMMRLQGQVKAQ